MTMGEWGWGVGGRAKGLCATLRCDTVRIEMDSVRGDTRTMREVCAIDLGRPRTYSTAERQACTR
jgi:hypothetical protein